MSIDTLLLVATIFSGFVGVIVCLLVGLHATSRAEGKQPQEHEAVGVAKS